MKTQTQTPVGLLSYDEAYTMENNYKNIQYETVALAFAKENGGTFTDNREFWFSIEEILAYLNYVTDKGTKEGLQVSNMGIRFFLGAKVEANQQTPVTKLIFVPTASSNRTKTATPEDDTFYNAKPKDYGSSGRPPKTLKP